MPAPLPDTSVFDRLRDAINTHEPERVAACFTEDFRCEMPHHPERNFVGSDTVRQNYTRIFEGAPDLRATVLRTAVDGEEAWSEWEMRGTTPSGAPVSIAGPVIVTTREGRIARARFYLDPVGSQPGS